MKIKTSQINIRKIGLIVPVLAYFLIYGIFSMVSVLTMRIYSHQSFASIAYTIPYINMISLICAIYTQRRKGGDI
jgi:two-component system LytT family sensor kinase